MNISYPEGDRGGYLHRLRLANMAAGRNLLGSKPVTSLYGLEEGNVIQFLYKAESPGFPKPGLNPINPNIYDAAPLVYVSKVSRTKDRNIILTGANLHYLPSKIDKSNVILSMNILSRIQTSLYKQCVHAYRTDRIKSKIYQVMDIAIDSQVLLTIPVWKPINQ